MADDNDQFKLQFNPAVSHAITEDAIHRAEFLTGPARKAQMMEAIRSAFSKDKLFAMSDVVWIELGEVGDRHRGGKDNGSGLGPVMRAANHLGEGLILNSGLFRRSGRGPMHGKAEVLWKSLQMDAYEASVEDQIKEVQKLLREAASKLPFRYQLIRLTIDEVANAIGRGWKP